MEVRRSSIHGFDGMAAAGTGAGKLHKPCELQVFMAQLLLLNGSKE